MILLLSLNKTSPLLFPLELHIKFLFHSLIYLDKQVYFIDALMKFMDIVLLNCQVKIRNHIMRCTFSFKVRMIWIVV